jgi:hypothetical protein
VPPPRRLKDYNRQLAKYLVDHQAHQSFVAGAEPLLSTLDGLKWKLQGIPHCPWLGIDGLNLLKIPRLEMTNCDLVHSAFR